MNRVLWPLGILVLVASLVGAGWALQQSNPHPNDEGRAKDEPLKEVYCLGFVDVEKGVADLFPKQAGQIVWLADSHGQNEDGTESVKTFKKGELLLRLEDEIAGLQLAK